MDCAAPRAGRPLLAAVAIFVIAGLMVSCGGTGNGFNCITGFIIGRVQKLGCVVPVGASSRIAGMSWSARAILSSNLTAVPVRDQCSSVRQRW
jgi:hypothetical protein